VDSTDLTIDEVIDQMLTHVWQKMRQTPG